MRSGFSGEHLALVIDPDSGSRRSVRRLLGSIGFDVVHAPNGLVALELIQRLPETFRLVLTELDLPGLSGPVVRDTLRLFRPELPVLCMARTVGVSARTAGCLAKPLEPEALNAQVRAALAGASPAWEMGLSDSDDAVIRARACYEDGHDLVAAALQLARGYRDEP
jgi:DNA-binding response OmpR family regulator